jgi:ATP-dependent Clp protease ATP-binding subunit ClpX
MLIRILTEPKNAVMRQFQRFFALDGVELVFTPDALEACADEAIRHKTGARGLRTVLEDTLLDVMYEVPSRTDVQKCIVNGDTIRQRRRPLLVTRSGQEIAPEDSIERLKGVSA